MGDVTKLSAGQRASSWPTGGLVLPFGDLDGDGSYKDVVGGLDLSGDGRADLISLDKDGRAWLNRGNGHGGLDTGRRSARPRTGRTSASPDGAAPGQRDYTVPGNRLLVRFRQFRPDRIRRPGRRNAQEAEKRVLQRGAQFAVVVGEAGAWQVHAWLTNTSSAHQATPR